MKVLLIAALAMSSINVFSSTNLEDQKLITSNAIDLAITRLEGDKPCVKDAKSIETLKACRDKLRADMGDIRESIKDTRKDIKKFHEKNDSKSL